MYPEIITIACVKEAQMDKNYVSASQIQSISHVQKKLLCICSSIFKI